MAQNKAALKSRIKSVTATKKITNAMKLIATVKLQKQRGVMLKNRDYSNVLKDTVNEILSGEITTTSPFVVANDNPIRFFFVYCSDMGLCGGYNVNINKLAEEQISKEDYIYLIGHHQYNWFVKNGFNVINEEPIHSDAVDYSYLKKLADVALDYYVKGKVGKISVLYTQFINNVTFNPVVEDVLPCALDETETKKEDTGYVAETLLEPNADDILNNLIPMMVENTIYNKWLQSKTSEQGSRRFAMENATDNANELTEKLVLQYNQARQAAITSEITEIIAGADAL